MINKAPDTIESEVLEQGSYYAENGVTLPQTADEFVQQRNVNNDEHLNRFRLHSSAISTEVLPVLVNGVMSSIDSNKSRAFRQCL